MSMNSADTSADQSVEQDHHRPFWVLPTSEVNGFMVSAIERFLWPIEVASCLADEIGINGSIATREEQLLNTGMVIAALETLRAFADTTLTGRSALWKTSYVRRANKARQLGLGFKKSMAVTTSHGKAARRRGDDDLFPVLEVSELRVVRAAHTISYSFPL